MRPTPLTRRQRDILDFFERYTIENGISPTFEEIAGALGVNKVTVFGHVAELERKGVLVRAARGVSRALQLTGRSRESSRMAWPILGTVAAGAPIEALEVREEFALVELAPRGADCYVLRVRGDSMVDDGIRDGDYVVVERRTLARNGETVVAVLPDGTATLKRYYLEGNRVRLQPANHNLSPILVREVEIRGVVRGVIRRL